MTPSDGPGDTPPGGTPPPPPYPGGSTVPAPAPRATPPAVARKRRFSPFRMLVIGLVVGIILGGAAGYFIFNGRTVSITKVPQATPSASSSPTAVTTPTPLPATSAPVQTPVTAPVGVAPCPVATPTGQHQLGNPAPPGSGQSAATALEFCGGGDATIPPGTARFLTNNTWSLGIADSCPVGSSGQSGMNTVLTVTEVVPGGGQGPDTATEPGDWVDGGAVAMATGGSYQLRVTTVSPGCVWHIKIYPSS